MTEISIIMGVYNTSKEYLDKAVFSILNQTFKNFEFIIYDDGSNEKVNFYLNEISKLDSRIILIGEKENKGLSYALNRCLDKATGKYIARMDSDDYCDIYRLEKQLEYIKKNELDVVGCDILLFNKEEVWGKVKYNKNISNEDFLYNSPMAHPTIIAKKEAFSKVGGYCEEPYCLRNEDYDLFMKMKSSGLKLGNINEYLYYFREDNDAISRRKFKYRINEFKVRKKGFKLLKLYPKGIIYLFKPIIVGLLPKWLYKKLKLRKLK